MPPVGFEHTISADERPLGPGLYKNIQIKVKSDDESSTLFTRIYLRLYQLVRLATSINKGIPNGINYDSH